MVGFPATLIHGDTFMLDRWLWTRRRLAKVPTGSKKVLDVGCGTGAFTIGVSRLGYEGLGLSWDERNQRVAVERAAICGTAPLVKFEIQDVRNLDQRKDLYGCFDVALCFENIEHILNDSKLMVDMSRCLKPGGTLLLTTPNVNYKPLTRWDDGPFSETEDGGHVRRGYTAESLTRLCAVAGLKVCEINYCGGFLSQKITALSRVAASIHWLLGWALILPLRLLPPVFDPLVSRYTRWPGYSITLVAAKC
jgi:2-polyprenyl-3-methyl-5-hydroxy-6-metoxy-1,4-benzoquinol methylase